MVRYVLEAEKITGPFRLVTYMAHLGPQMYFQHMSSAAWSQNGSVGVMFSSGNWYGCAGKTANPPGGRYGLVTTEFGLVSRKALQKNS